MLQQNGSDQFLLYTEGSSSQTSQGKQGNFIGQEYHTCLYLCLSFSVSSASGVSSSINSSSSINYTNYKDDSFQNCIIK